MIRWACVAVLALLPACATTNVQKVEKAAHGYAGRVQKVFQVVRQGDDLPGFRLLGQKAQVIAPMLRQSSETLQYVVRTPTGQIIAQSDDEFSVGDCVEVVPHADAAGPAFRYGQAQIVKSEKCTT
jgi:hypothetical protein